MLDPIAWIGDELSELEASHLLRDPAIMESIPGPEVKIGGRTHVLAGSNNYLGLAGDDRIIEAACDAAWRWGAGSGASPLVSGLTAAQRELEGGLAELKSADDSVVFSSGYLANIGAIQALVGAGDVVFSDELNHASIIDGCRLSRATPVIYPHCDAGALEALIRKGGYRRALIVTDSVFSMDGDIAPLVEIADIAGRYGAMTIVDEAHATGVIGPGGRGAIAHLGLDGTFDAVVGTLSKAFGSAGGFVAGSSRLASWLRNKARSQVFDTAPVPAAIGAARAALDVIYDEPERRDRIGELRRRLRAGLLANGYDVAEREAAIIPVVVGESGEALELATQLRDAGVFAPAIRPPSVPVGTARIRLTVMATHSDAHAAQIIDAFASAAATAAQ